MAEGLSRAEILRRRRDLSRVRRFGSRTGNRFLSLRFTPAVDQSACGSDPAALPVRRVAFLVPRAVGGAVDRNLLKRRLREIYRRNKTWFPEGHDCLVLPSAAAARLSFTELAEQTRQAAARALETMNGTIA